VKLWDLTRCGVPTKFSGGDDDEMDGMKSPAGVLSDDSAGAAIRSFDNVHKDKVQAVQWNDKEPTALLTGSYDRTVRVFDTRAPDGGVGAVVGADVEALRWDPWESHSFYVSLENGFVVNFDVRALPSAADFSSSASPARITLQAHDGAASTLDINPHVRGCIVTGGTDKIVKIWDVNPGDEAGEKRASLVTSRDLGVGKVFTAMFSPDDPLTVAAAGSKAKMQVWNVAANAGARKVFGARLSAAGRQLKEAKGGGVIGVQDDDEGSGWEDDE
jgi:periodic tryptophan protein 1